MNLSAEHGDAAWLQLAQAVHDGSLGACQAKIGKSSWTDRGGFVVCVYVEVSMCIACHPLKASRQA